MPEHWTSAGWVFVGWGFACGVALTLCAMLPLLWRWRDRSRDTTAGARDRSVARIRDTAALRTLRAIKPAGRPVAPVVGRAAVVCGEVTQPLGRFADSLDRVNHSAAVVDWLLNQPSAPLALNVKPRRPMSLSGAPVPDDDRPIEPDESEDYPRRLVRGDGVLAGWPPRLGVLAADGASFVRHIFRRGAEGGHKPRHAAPDERRVSA